MQTLSFVRTHRRASSTSNLGPLLSECYSTTSTNECGYTLHARVMSAGPSLASKDHSQEKIVIFYNTIFKRGYYHPQVNVRHCQHVQAHFPSFILELHSHPIITPPFQGGNISSTYSLFVRGGFISLTSSSFSRRFHMFDL